MRYDLQIEPMVWSYSRLTAFEQCPYSWLQRYIYRIRAQPQFFAQYGTLIHSILQQYLSGTLARKRLVGYYLTHFVTDITEPAPSKRVYKNYLEQGRQYFKTITFPDRKKLGIEEKVRFDVKGHPFMGIIDLVTEDDKGKLYITDHKSRMLKPRSGHRKPTKADGELDSYLRQLYLYAGAVHEKYGRWPDYLEFNCFRSGTWISEPFNIKQYEAVETWADNLINRIQVEDEWNPNTQYWFCNNLCDTCAECEYRNSASA